MSSYNFSVGGQSYDFIPAEVIDVNYTDNNVNNLYSIKVKLLHRDSSQNPSDLLSARPLNHNVKRIPLKGEVVLLLKGPTSYGAGLTETTENYYLDVFSVQNGLHHNAIPKRHFINVSKRTDYTNTQEGFPEVEQTKDKKKELAKSFEEQNTIRPLQPFAGDMLIEGRTGNSIRFGSSLNVFGEYKKQPNWKTANGSPGDPIIVIRNGQRDDIGDANKFIIEDIDKDKSSIYMTSTQQLQFTPSSTNLTSISDKGVDTFNKSKKFSGNQIGLFADRVIINSKKNEVIMFSKNGFGFTTPTNVSFDVDNTFEVNAKKRINLGYQGDEPALMGDTSGDWLSELLTELITLCNTLASEIHGTGTGPSTPPLNAPSYISTANKINILKTKIPTLKSQLVYLNKK